MDIKTIEQINEEIKKCVKRSNKIENGNYILAMLLKDIRDGKVVDLMGVVRWCFETMKTGRLVDDVLKGIEGDRENELWINYEWNPYRKEICV